MDRVAYSPEDIAGRDYTIKLMQEAGLETRIDAAGNIIGRRAGSDDNLPAIALGSHTDTVPKGGKYDGALGVMGAIEVIRTLEEQGHRTRHPLEVIDFANEEGTRFHRWLLGSRAMSGLLLPEDLAAVDDEGVTLASRMSDIGGDLSRVDEAQRAAGELAAFFELHIEQGPTLYQTGTPIGVVTGITGRAMFEVEIDGMANHAGTTPMPDRHDALVSASRLVLAVQRMAAEDEICRVATTGAIEAHPNAANVIPGKARISVEFRDVSMDALSAAETELRRAVERVSSDEGVTMQIHRQRFTSSVPIADSMQAMVEEAAGRSSLESQRLPSGAGHDAQALAQIAEMAMIFVPSVNGISHSPEEFTTPEDCANGAQTLLNLLTLADERI
jgi:N-carbamoyl-L-amino-acid hydrolase